MDINALQTNYANWSNYNYSSIASNKNSSNLKTDSIFNYSKQDENYNIDTESLQDDWDYFCELEKALIENDPDAAEEILGITAQSTVDAEDSNAKQLNKNTELLLNLQKRALKL